MQFSKIFLFATAATFATAAPIEARDEYKVSHRDGKWYKGWDNSEPLEQYICQTTGLLNVLTCSNVLNGNTLNLNLLSILGL
ncbi:hypothetical protein MBLNU13_g01787t1 [Cladosporium sp. NU13]